MVEPILRPVTQSDARTIFEWRNDPWVASKGALNKTVTWEEHSNWFARVLKADEILMYVIEIEGQGIGQIRFHKLENEKETWEISIYLLQPHTGKGLGVTAIQQGCARLAHHHPGCKIIANVLNDTRHSQTAFEKAGFIENTHGAQKTYIWT